MTIELFGILTTVVIQALYIAYKIGKFEQKLEMIDKKQDKPNNLIERMVRVEDSVKSAHNCCNFTDADFFEFFFKLFNILNT